MAWVCAQQRSCDTTFAFRSSRRSSKVSHVSPHLAMCLTPTHNKPTDCNSCLRPHTTNRTAGRSTTVSWRLQAAAADGAYEGQWDEPVAVPISQGASKPATVFNLVNVIMGAGYVSIPFACRHGGWVALAVLWLLGAVFCYTGHALLQCCKLVDQETATAQAKSSREGRAVPAAPSAGYEAVAGRAFGKLGLAIVSAIMYAELLGICCVYVVLEAETLSTLLGATAFGSTITQTFGPAGFGFLASALMVPTVLMPDLNSLSVLGALGVCAAAAVGLALAGLYLSGGSAALSGVADTALVKLQTLPQVLGILAFVYAGHSTFPVVQQSMEKPSWGPKAVTWGYVITAVICTLIGGFGYALYGHQTQAVITASLPAMSFIALLCTGLTLCNPFSAFALTLEPVALVIQQVLAKSAGSANSSSNGAPGVPYHVRAAVRLGLALACCAVALSLPYVADLMAFVGALLTMSISLIIPALMHATLMRQQMSWWGLAVDGAVLLLGVVCAAVGASSAYGNLQLKLAAAAVH